MPQSPNAGQQHEMRIPVDAEVLKVLKRLISALWRNRSLMGKAPQYLCNFKIEEMWRMKGLVARIDSLVNAFSGRCLEKPVHCGGGIENDHLASRSSRSSRAVSICADTGLRLCRRSRNSASVGLSAISLISRNR